MDQQPKKITIVDNHNDWMGIYVDGKLMDEGHRLTLTQGLEAIGLEFDEIKPDNRWMYYEGRLPKDLKDVKVGSDDDDWCPEEEWGTDED